MVTIKNKKIEHVWYDLEIGYYTFWESRWFFDEFYPEQNIQAPYTGLQENCVLIPAYPLYGEKVFSKGTLRGFSHERA